jgi:hypothetical protein
VITALASKLEISPQYSPEYCFARAMTQHYDELAEACPQFAFLREIAKFVAFSAKLNELELNSLIYSAESDYKVRQQMRHRPLKYRNNIMEKRNKLKAELKGILYFKNFT